MIKLNQPHVTQLQVEVPAKTERQNKRNTSSEMSQIRLCDSQTPCRQDRIPLHQ